MTVQEEHGNLLAKICTYKVLHMSCGEKLAEELRAKGFRMTPQRMVILETIAHIGGHLSVQEVFTDAQQRLPGLNIATVYRTLDSLHRAGMVDLFYTGFNPARFSLRDPDYPHGHLMCTNCEQILDIDPGLITSIAQVIYADTGFFLDRNHLTLSGLCNLCKKQTHTQE